VGSVDGSGPDIPFAGETRLGGVAAQPSDAGSGDARALPLPSSRRGGSTQDRVVRFARDAAVHPFVCRPASTVPGS